MSISGGKTKQRSEPVFFGPSKIMLPAQKRLWGAAAPSLLDKAMQGGYSPSEKSRIYTGMTENINRGTQSALAGMRDEFARSGLTGGVMAGDIGDIMEARIGAFGQASTALEQMNRAERNRRWKRLLGMAKWQPPHAVGQRSKLDKWHASIGLPSGGGSTESVGD